MCLHFTTEVLRLVFWVPIINGNRCSAVFILVSCNCFEKKNNRKMWLFYLEGMFFFCCEIWRGWSIFMQQVFKKQVYSNLFVICGKEYQHAFIWEGWQSWERVQIYAVPQHRIFLGYKIWLVSYNLRHFSDIIFDKVCHFSFISSNKTFTLDRM